MCAFDSVAADDGGGDGCCVTFDCDAIDSLFDCLCDYVGAVDVAAAAAADVVLCGQMLKVLAIRYHPT